MRVTSKKLHVNIPHCMLHNKQPKFEKEIAVLDALSKRVIIGLLRHASPDLQDLLTKEVSQLASIF